MKNNTTSGGGRYFFSSWTAPQNPIITLLKRKRESKATTQNEKASVISSKTSTTDTKQQQIQQHQKQQIQQQQQVQQQQQQQVKVHQPSSKTSFKIMTSSTTSTPIKSNGTSPQNANDYTLRTETNGFQPMKIEDYEPGHSSIAMREELLEPPEYNPPICKPGDLCRYSESKESKNFRIRKKNEITNGSVVSRNSKINKASRDIGLANHNNNNRDGADDDDDDETLDGSKSPNPHIVYKNVQAGGTIPEEGLWNLIEPRRVKTLPPPPASSTTTAMKKSLSAIPNGNPSELERIFQQEAINRLGRKKTREEIEEEMRTRKKTMEKIIALEKLKKLEEEKRSNEARRHNDNFLPIEKSPVKLNRYDDEAGSRIRTSNIGKTAFTAIALYNFKSKNERELGLRKGDTVHVLKQIDKNWFEGERNGLTGIFPITYVKIHLPLSQGGREPTLKGKVLYDFIGNAPPELSLYKGERVTIVGSIDDNWVEGRSRNGEGIFPLNYVKILEDGDDDDVSRSSSVYGTPIHSRTNTPSFDHRNAYSRFSLRERPKEPFRVVSPAGSTASSYAPTIPSAPMSPYGSQDLDTTLGSFGGVRDWPSLEASLLDLEKASISQLMQRQQKQQRFDRAGIGGGDKMLERSASLQQKYRPQQTQIIQQQQQRQQLRQQESAQEQLKQEQQLLHIQREVERQRRAQQRLDQLDRFQEKSRDFLSQSAHPDLCVDGNLSNKSPPTRAAALTRSATNSGFPERSHHHNYGYNQSSPYHRYPSLISKDTVVIDDELVVKDMMAKQSEAVAKEFMTRHGSNASLARSTTPLVRQSLPVTRDVYRASTLQRPVSSRPEGMRAASTTPSMRDEEIFSFKEIKLKPKLPADYARPAYVVETRTSLTGKSDILRITTDRGTHSPFIGPREVSPMKSYEWHKVLYDYIPRKLDEVHLAMGDMVQVVEKCRDGWWLGISQTTGKMGLFPGNHVIPS